MGIAKFGGMIIDGTNPAPFLPLAKKRGFVHDCTNTKELNKWLCQPRRAYIGFDLTAPSLHVGSLFPIMLLRLFQRCGHQPIVLLGSGTTKIGDPSGKDETRPLQDQQSIRQNAKSIKSIIARFLKTEGENKVLFIHNDDWLDGLNYIEFLRDIGRHFSVNKMLQAESIRQRLKREQNLSFLEFNYMLLQSYDFYQLSKRAECLLQMGGSDQWGNITAGIDLIRRLTQRQAFGLTAPLLLTHDGKKMGKTANGAVWLSDDHLKPWDYWQYWRNVDDQDVKRFLCLFTELSLDEIEELTRKTGAYLNEAKKRLANEATRLCHGDKAAEQCSEKANRLFEAGSSLKDSLNEENPWEIKDTSLVDVLTQSGMTPSRSAARRLIEGGGIKVGDVTITDIHHRLDKNLPQQIISIGKKKNLMVAIR